LLSFNKKISHLEVLNVVEESINPTINNTLEVDTTAYTSHKTQTNGEPMMTAWGDHLKPKTKAIAVSHDLLTEYGLTYRTKVTIAGFSGEFLVLDKMHKRWRKRIDIYRG
jgi:3D (Asp-Asp-Asp) domain-containing protein